MQVEPSPTDDWVSLINGDLLARDGRHLFERADAALSAFLSEDGSGGAILAVIEKRLGGEITQEAWAALEDALHDYLGPDIAYLITWLVVEENAGQRLEEFAQVASADSTELLRTVIGLYGDELKRAFAVGTGAGHDWRRILQEVNLDQLSGRFLLRLRLLKLNGEWVLVESSPNSMLNLARNILQMLNAVETTDLYNPDVKDAFVAQAETLLRALRPEPAGAKAAGASPTPLDSSPGS